MRNVKCTGCGKILSQTIMTDLNFTGIVGLILQEQINSEFILSRSS